LRTPYRRSKPVVIASEVKLVDSTASARMPGVSVSTGLCENVRSKRFAPAIPATSTISGITTASNSCSPLRSSSRVSMRACASTILGSGAAPGRGANVIRPARVR
jgi:hypothetical protein